MQQANRSDKPLILIVEDNQDLRENASLVLKLEGYEVMSASDGQEAVDMLMEGRCYPDLIVSDIAMPRLDGYGFFEAVRKMPHLRGTPFIFLTARSSRRDIRFGKELGVDDYLVKPFNSTDFIIAVKNKLMRAADMRDLAARELDDARRLVVQLISHELRTPLTYVSGGFSLLADGLEQDKLPADLQVSMGLIRSGTNRLNRLAEQLVNYTELVSGHTGNMLNQLALRTDLETVIRQAITQTQRDLAQKGTQFIIENQASEPIYVNTVADVLKNAIYEVLRNASTFSPERAEVRILLQVENNKAIITITDTGIGIKPEDQAKIWDIMIQSNRIKQEQQGAGMGLPVVKQIMKLHQGTAELYSVPKEGTQVTLTLPIYQNPSETTDPATVQYDDTNGM